jgi:pyridoxal phosphate enzyme (YggS family)
LGPEEEVGQNISYIRSRMAAAAQRAGRPINEISLIAVSKNQSAGKISAALALGQRVFGENRVQEADEHWTAIRASVPDIELHLIGPLQSNKAEDAVRIFDVIQTIDRPKILDKLKAACEKINKTPKFFIQVNTGEEPQKSGVIPSELKTLLEYSKYLDLNIAGLMCIPPSLQPAAPHFAFLKKLADSFKLPSISMGMTGDYEAAIELGATHVRVGSGIFGSR